MKFQDIGLAQGLLCLCYFLLVFFGPGEVFWGDPGLGWHFRAGQLILERGQIPRVDPFSFHSPALPWVDSQWLSQVLFWMSVKYDTYSRAHAFALGLCFLPFLILLPRLSFPQINPIFFAAALFLLLLTAAIQWIFRPVLFSFIFFAVVYRWAHQVDERREFPRYSWALPLLFALWANMHPGFILGFLPLGVLFSSFLLSSRLGKVSKVWGELLCLIVLCFLATAINPYGLSLYRAIFSLVGSSYFMKLNGEWLPPTLNEPGFWPFFAVLAVLCLAQVRALRQGSKVRPAWTIFETVLLLVLSVAACCQRRYIPFFAIAAAAPLAKSVVLWPVPGIFQRLGRAFVVAPRFGAFFLLWLVAVISPFLPDADKQLSSFLPLRTLDYLESRCAQACQGVRVFSHPDWGGYFIWRLWPQVQVYIDDRNEVYGEERYRQFFRLALAADGELPGGWEQEFDALGIDWVVLPREAKLLSELKRKNWALSFKEDLMGREIQTWIAPT